MAVSSMAETLSNGYTNTEHDAMAELRIGKLMNLTLKAVMNGDRLTVIRVCVATGSVLLGYAEARFSFHL